MPAVVAPSGGCLGARVASLEPSAPLDDAGFRDVEAIIHRHQVAAFSDQQLDEDALIAFARRFGEPGHNLASSFLIFLFAHQTEACATIHMATGGYDASTPRLMHRAQVPGDDALYRQKNAASGKNNITRGG